MAGATDQTILTDKTSEAKRPATIGSREKDSLWADYTLLDRRHVSSNFSLGARQ
jgi:hypothetical protein